MNHYKNGQKAEYLAASWLFRQGMKILDRNYRCKKGEIDLIGCQDGYLVFVEVKARKTNVCGYPGEALTAWKKRRICQTARFYCLEKKISLYEPLRFDVVEIMGNQIRHIKNAFDFVQ